MNEQMTQEEIEGTVRAARDSVWVKDGGENN